MPSMPSHSRSGPRDPWRPIPAGQAPIAPPPVVVALAIVAIVAFLFVWVALSMVGNVR